MGGENKKSWNIGHACTKFTKAKRFFRFSPCKFSLITRWGLMPHTPGYDIPAALDGVLLRRIND